ncbi:sensor histidine kinase [Streptomyces sp. NPDC012693]|jgi:two-component system sensor histidine kinase DesK|uniref:sensor histidine kinase n=1 Tax=unclassified Streptomyces TaxID=2593676 RepID=UPI00202E1E06|nr:histidine kinase [Streptomyces sp. MSC1_001]
MSDKILEELSWPASKQNRATLWFTPRVATALVALVQCGFGLMGFLNLLARQPARTEFAGCSGAFLAVFVLQLTHCLPQTKRFRARYGLWTLGLQAVCTLVPVLVFGIAWGGMAGFVAGSCLLVAPAPLSLALFALVVVTMTATAAWMHLSGLDMTYLTLATMMTGLFVYSVTRLTELLGEAQAQRNALAEFAVARERLRFARDLHDLLGYSLSSITLKSELISRFIGSQDARAREELRDVLNISRQALADVRAVADGYRELSLSDEIASAERVLRSTGISTYVHQATGPLSSRVETVLATVLREGVTNLLRHSEARHCRISLTEENGAVRLRLDNDGVPASAAETPARDGAGLESLAIRLGRVSGSLAFERDDKGWFRLTARCPAHPALETVRSSPTPRRSESRRADYAR